VQEQETAKRQESRAIDALYRISTLAGKHLNPVRALEAILDEVMRVFSANSASISLLNASSESLLIEVQRGLPESSKGFELPVGVGITGWVAAHGEPLLCTDVSREEKYFQIDERVKAEMAAPLTEGGRTVGALNVDSCDISAFDEEDLRLLVLMANEASRVLENMWMVQQLRKKADQLQSLVLLSQDISGKRKFDEVLNTISREGLFLLDCRLSAFFLYDQKQDLLHLQSLHDKNGPRSYHEALKPGDSLLGSALRGHRQVQTKDLLRIEEHHFIDLIRSENLVSMLVTPVIFEDIPIGLIVHYIDRPHRFHDDEQMIARALADLGAIAIENARLYDRVFDSEESMRKSERLTTLGTLAAEIAHEIRNPLMVVRLLFDSLNLGENEDDNKSKDLSVIREKLNHLEQIAGRILEFGKSRESFRKSIYLREILEDAAVLVRLKLEQSKVNLNWGSLPGEEEVFVDKGQIQQVLLNLMLNAVEVMPNGGDLFIDTELNEGRAKIFVKDQGGGIPNDLKDRIFESFLTGKKDGTGLGLTISKRIMRAHDGDLELVHTGSEGTTFCISLSLSV
jgi:signal transduction histidine kinase/putative methionine-R-sulfoxide reductase with GAF domain